MEKVMINLYSFDELTERAQRKAIEEHRCFMLEDMSISDYIGCGDPDIDTPEAMYDADYEYILNNDEGVIDSIEANEYMFYYDGSIANIQYRFVAGRRETYLRAHGQDIVIEWRAA